MTSSAVKNKFEETLCVKHKTLSNAVACVENTFDICDAHFRRVEDLLGLKYCCFWNCFTFCPTVINVCGCFGEIIFPAFCFCHLAIWMRQNLEMIFRAFSFQRLWLRVAIAWFVDICIIFSRYLDAPKTIFNIWHLLNFNADKQGAPSRPNGWGTKAVWSRFFPFSTHRHNVKNLKYWGDVPHPPVVEPLLPPLLLWWYRRNSKR